jgi:predicted nucleic acid-binding protein
MILADSAVVIELSRRPTPQLRSIIQQQHAAICGATVAEVYAGCRTDQEFQRADGILSLFGRVEIPDAVWSTLGRILSRTESKGRPVAFADALIAATAIHHAIELWTRDAHHRRMQQFIPELKLFAEPSP